MLFLFFQLKNNLQLLLMSLADVLFQLRQCLYRTDYDEKLNLINFIRDTDGEEEAIRQALIILDNLSESDEYEYDSEDSSESESVPFGLNQFLDHLFSGHPTTNIIFGAHMISSSPSTSQSQSQSPSQKAEGDSISPSQSENNLDKGDESENICSICTEQIEQTRVKVKCCNVYFCPPCLEYWLKEAGCRCPTCHSDIEGANTIFR